MFSLLLENPLLFEELLGECLKLRISKTIRENYFALLIFRWNLISNRMHLLVKELSCVLDTQLLLLLAVSFEWHSEREQCGRTVGIVLLPGTPPHLHLVFIIGKVLGNKYREIRSPHWNSTVTGNTVAGAPDNGQFAGRI